MAGLAALSGDDELNSQSFSLTYRLSALPAADKFLLREIRPTMGEMLWLRDIGSQHINR